MHVATKNQPAWKLAKILERINLYEKNDTFKNANLSKWVKQYPIFQTWRPKPEDCKAFSYHN